MLCHVYEQRNACTCVEVLLIMAEDGMRRRTIVEWSCYFCFLCAKMYSRSFIKLQLNHWCHMDCFTDVLTTFLGLGTFQLHCSLGRVRKLSDFIKKYLNLCSEDEQRSYGFGTTWGWVINDIILIFVWTNPLKGGPLIKLLYSLTLNWPVQLSQAIEIGSFMNSKMNWLICVGTMSGWGQELLDCQQKLKAFNVKSATRKRELKMLKMTVCAQQINLNSSRRSI